jgi:hypothetical protein
MELQVTKVTTEQEQSVMAYIICQRFAAFTKGSPVGTSNLLNCMGIVIHNTVGRVGVVAHVEAQTSTEHYNAVVDKVLKALIDKLNSYVDIGRFSVVLLGNAGGSDEKFCNGVEESLYKQAGPGRLDEVNIVDNRNGRAYGMIGGGAVFGSYHGCVYQPKKETLWLYGWSSVVGRSESQPPDVETLEIQTERN